MLFMDKFKIAKQIKKTKNKGLDRATRGGQASSALRGNNPNRKFFKMKEVSEGYKKACEVASLLASDKELSEKAHGILTSADLDEKSFVELLFETEEVKESCSLQDGDCIDGVLVKTRVSDLAFLL